MYAITATDIPAYAHALISDDSDAPTLECDRCGHSVDTYRGANDEPDAEIRAFLEHTAYDHGGVATILEVRRTRSAQVLTASFPNLPFGAEAWQAPKAHAFGVYRGVCVFCGVHRDSDRASTPCADTSKPAGIITL